MYLVDDYEYDDISHTYRVRNVCGVNVFACDTYDDLRNDVSPWEGVGYITSQVAVEVGALIFPEVPCTLPKKYACFCTFVGFL